MKKYFYLFLSVIILTCVSYSKNMKDSNSLFRVKKIIDIAPAWSGHSAAFALVTDKNKQFVAFYDPNRQLTLATRNLNSTNWTFVKLDEFVALDAHNYIAMTIDRDGYLHLSANMHVDPLKYWRTAKPYDLSSFKKLDYMTGKEETHCTYPRFFHDENGNLLFKYRSGHSGAGNEIINIYDEKTKTWKRKIKDNKSAQNLSNQKQKILPVGNSPDKKDVPLLDGKGLMNAYQAGPSKGPDGYFHLAWVWRDHYGCESNHDLQYAKSKDLIHWENSSGKKINLPLTINNAEMVDSIQIYGGMLNNVKLSFDSKGRVVLTYFKFDQNGNTQVYAARRERKNWKIYQVTDWTNRWDFNGGGSIPNMIVNTGVNYKRGIGLYYQFRNKYIFGNLRRYVYFLDENNLEPNTAPVPVYPDIISVVRSKVKGMQINLAGHWPYFLRWEALGGQRDIVKKLDWVPKNQMLQLIEIDWNKSIDKKPYVPLEQRNASYKEFFEKLQRSNNKVDEKIKVAVNNKNYKVAVKLLRQNQAKIPFDFRTVNEKEFLNIADNYLNHKFNFNNIKRTLLFDIQVWYPFKKELLENWDITRALTLKCRPVKFDELNKISPLAKWYNELNCLPHIEAFAKAYAITKNKKYVRKLIHDVEDWMYDNPVPKTKQEIPGPWYPALVQKRLKNSLSNFVPLLAKSKYISDDEFFFFINTVQKHKDYLKK